MWYVILDQSGEAKQQHFDSQRELVEWLEKGLGLKQMRINKWARDSKSRFVLAAFKEWSDAQKMASQIREMARLLKA